MPWTAADAQRHTKKANTPKKQKLWAKVANESLDKDGDEGEAIRKANAVISRIKSKKATAMTKEPRYDPLFSNNTTGFNSVLAASVDAPVRNRPKSPISGQPMEPIYVGNYGKKPFLAWAHLGDRIVVPMRKDEE